jgi:hypothetical protein
MPRVGVRSLRTLMFAGFRSRWMIPCACGFEGFGDLLRDRHHFVDGNGPWTLRKDDAKQEDTSSGVGHRILAGMLLVAGCLA